MKTAARPDWIGRTVVCIASGPSLTADDCEKVRRSGLDTIVTNTSFRLAPWADVVFAMDTKWWRQHKREVEANCSGRRLSTNQAARAYGAETTWGCTWMPHVLNSGAGSIGVALGGGAARIILLGYDCQKTGGKTHWHGDHPKELGNAGSLKFWPKHFASMGREAARLGCTVLNASRETALTCFERVSLEQALADATIELAAA